MSTEVKSLLRIVLVGAVSIIGLNLTPTSGWAQGACASLGSEAAITAKADELFRGWNVALQTGKPNFVVDRYASKSILLPTVSNQPRLTAAEKTDYFVHFQEKRPSGDISPVISPVIRKVFCDNNTLTDAGLYTFNYDPGYLQPGQPLFTRARYSFTYHFDGQQWLITSHHSSAMPETEVFCPVAIPYAEDPKKYCPRNCSGASAEWSWSFWSSYVTDILGRASPACECFRTPKEPAYMGTCQKIPTKG